MKSAKQGHCLLLDHSFHDEKTFKLQGGQRKVGRPKPPDESRALYSPCPSLSTDRRTVNIYRSHFLACFLILPYAWRAKPNSQQTVLKEWMSLRSLLTVDYVEYVKYVVLYVLSKTLNILLWRKTLRSFSTTMIFTG